ncbi:uncharacterized protein LOC144300597 isoform X3 [Canis aureus]
MAMHTLYLRVQCQNVGEEWCTVPDEVYICSHLNKSCKAGAAPESVQIISPQIWTPGHSSCTQMNAPMSKLPLQPVQSHLDCWQMVFSEQAARMKFSKHKSRQLKKIWRMENKLYDTARKQSAKCRMWDTMQDK